MKTFEVIAYAREKKKTKSFQQSIGTFETEAHSAPPGFFNGKKENIKQLKSDLKYSTVPKWQQAHPCIYPRVCVGPSCPTP